MSNVKTTTVLAATAVLAIFMIGAAGCASGIHVVVASDAMSNSEPPQPAGEDRAIDWDEADGGAHSAFLAGRDLATDGTGRLRDGNSVGIGWVQSLEGTERDVAWLADGKPYHPSGAGDTPLHFRNSGDLPSHRRIFIKLKTALKEGEFLCHVRVPHTSGTTGYCAWGDGTHTYSVAEFLAPSNMVTSDVALGIAHGPFSVVPVTDKELRWTQTDAPMYAGTVEICSEVISVKVPKKYWYKSLVVVATDDKGIVHRQPVDQSAFAEAFRQHSDFVRARFCKISAGKATKVSLEYRDYEWLVFKNVHLWPNS